MSVISPRDAHEASRSTVLDFMTEHQRGYWLNGQEAGLAAGRTPQRVSDAAKRQNTLEYLTIGDSTNTYYHIAWIAQKWPEGAGAKAYRDGPHAYARWVSEIIEPLREARELRGRAKIITN